MTSRTPSLGEPTRRLYQLLRTWAPDEAGHAEADYYYVELLWSQAEREARATSSDDVDPDQQLWRWVDTAIAFTLAASDPGTDAERRKEAHYAAALAWHNVISGLDDAIGSMRELRDDSDAVADIVRARNDALRAAEADLDPMQLPGSELLD